jgi:hypothetical protein
MAWDKKDAAHFTLLYLVIVALLAYSVAMTWGVAAASRLPTYSQGVLDGRASEAIRSDRDAKILADMGLCHYAELVCKERKK